jgi:alcohol dehydrogenase (cytochrome c)
MSIGPVTQYSINTCLVAALAAMLSVTACVSQRADSAPAPNHVATGPAGGDWVSYNRTLAGDRFSPLTEISGANIGQLQQKCTYLLPQPTSFQTGPLVIDGTLYFTTDEGSYAIDAATCRERWKSIRPLPKGIFSLVNRGFAYLDGRLFRGTQDGHVIALSAEDGRTLWEVKLDVAGPGVTVPMAPVAADGKVFIGNAGGDLAGVTGRVYALSAESGDVLWRFDVVPETASVRATWQLPPGHPISGGGLWTSFAYDETNDVLYVPAGNPAPDFDIELRQGDNLYTNSIIAIDANTGRLSAYNQIVKNDNHDWDVSAAPALVTTASGRRIVASANKDGLLSVLDRGRVDAARTTGASEGGSEHELTGGLPLLFAVPTTTRKNVDAPLSRERATRFCPGINGGTEWNGPAFYPQLNTLYVGAVDWCAVVTLAERDAQVPRQGEVWLGNRGSLFDVFESWDNARGWLTAFDADSGTERWRFQTPKPIVAGVTTTAGGLVFAADLAGNVYALDAANGAKLWQSSTGQPIGGGIVSYAVTGRQLIAVASGVSNLIWPSRADVSSIVVYGLP